MLVSCNNTKTGSNEAVEDIQKEDSEVGRLEAELMESHDRTMAKMADMNKLIRKLKQTESASQDSTQRAQVIQSLISAQDAMMEWMREYKDVDKLNLNEDEKVEYLQSEKEKMEQIEEQTITAVDIAHKALVK